MGKIAALFPGQGAFYGGALQQARSAYMAVEHVLAITEDVALRRFNRSLAVAIATPGGAAALLQSDPDLLQLAIYTVSVAAYEALRAEGVEPHVLAGHSLGEIAALTCAGAYTIEQGAGIVCERIEALAEAAPRNGCMAAIMAGPDAVQRLLRDWNETRSGTPFSPAIAVENHDAQTVVSGIEGHIAGFVAFCAARKISAQRLHSPYGFHHPSLAAAERAFAGRLAAFAARPLQRPVFSPILGRYYRDNDNLGQCLSRHLVLPVRFSTAIRTLADEGVAAFVECGALDAMSKITIRVLGPGTVKTFPLFAKPGEELKILPTIKRSIKEIKAMPMTSANSSSAAFEAFWKERSPLMLTQIKAEFERFLSEEQARRAASSAVVFPLHSVPAVAAPSAPAPQAVFAAPPLPAAGSAAGGLPRAQLFQELAGIYADAMEYPREVFNETVELEAELGIDSVKQTEIMGRISSLYAMPPLPANVRISDYKTMGQIVDFVFAHQNKAA